MSAPLSSMLSLPQSDWSARSGRVPSLDGVRALSVALVLLGHILLPSNLVGVSALGLKTFFFLSGFLITRLLFAEGKETGDIRLPAFYLRRVLRLYPVILTYVAIVTAVTLARGERVEPVDLAGVFLYFVNYLVIHYDHLNSSISLPVGMLWSLSVEEHFYLIAPVALILLRRDPRKMLALAGAVCVMSLGLRLLYVHLWPTIINGLEIYWRSETRADCIAFGVMLACLPEFPAGQRWIRRLAQPGPFWFGLLLLAASFVYRSNYYQLTWRFTIQSLAMFPLLAGVIFAQPLPLANRLLNAKPVVWIGALSYSLYVWHGGVRFLFDSWLESMPSQIAPFIELLVAIALAALSYYLVERPVLRLRKPLMTRLKRSGAARVAPSA